MYSTPVENTDKTCEYRAKETASGKHANRDLWNKLFEELSEMCELSMSQAVISRQ